MCVHHREVFQVVLFFFLILVSYMSGLSPTSTSITSPSKTVTTSLFWLDQEWDTQSVMQDVLCFGPQRWKQKISPFQRRNKEGNGQYLWCCYRRADGRHVNKTTWRNSLQTQRENDGMVDEHLSMDKVEWGGVRIYASTNIINLMQWYGCKLCVFHHAHNNDLVLYEKNGGSTLKCNRRSHIDPTENNNPENHFNLARSSQLLERLQSF